MSSTQQQTVIYLVSPGPRPPFILVAHHLWAHANIDSDGNSAHPGDTQWTELSVASRDHPEREQQVHVDPVSESPLVLKIRSPSASLAERTARFLAQHTGGTISMSWP